MNTRTITNNNKRMQRKKRVRAKITGSSSCPRVSVFRSIDHIYAQIIDDTSQRTLVSARDTEEGSEKEEHSKTKGMTTKVAQAYKVGELLALKAKEKGITKVVFDRGHYKYHGRVKALAEGARGGGLKF